MQAEGLEHADDETWRERLVQSSGKLVLLDKLLPSLEKQGHRVLLFSQFKVMHCVVHCVMHYACPM